MDHNSLKFFIMIFIFYIKNNTLVSDEFQAFFPIFYSFELLKVTNIEAIFDSLSLILFIHLNFTRSFQH